MSKEEEEAKAKEALKEEAKAKATAELKKVYKSKPDTIVLMVEQVRYSEGNGIDGPVKVSKPYKFKTNARSFERNFLPYHRTQGLTIMDVLLMPDNVKFNHAEYLDAIKKASKPKRSAK